jgi:hypothetical protein
LPERRRISSRTRLRRFGGEFEPHQRADGPAGSIKGGMPIASDAHEIARFLIAHYGRDVRERVAGIVAAHRKLGHEGDAETWEEIDQAIARILSGANPD